MNFEPQKFFIGLVDFFSIILPGTLLTYFMEGHVAPWLLGRDSYAKLAGTDAGVAAFLFSSYLFGHFIFLLGSWLLDAVYDQLRDTTRDRQIERLALGGDLSPAPLRLLAKWWFKKDADRALSQAVRIKAHYLDPLGATSSVNAFQWAKARLTLEASAAMAAVQRFEADEKFFRSLVVVLAILIPWVLLTNREQFGTAAAAVPLLLLATWRYVDQRAKATNQAYWFVITAEAAREAGYRATTPKRPPRAPTHAGGVVYRFTNEGQAEFLLVQATGDPDDWVLPKGHIEANEYQDVARTAVREVSEEAGVWGSVRSVLRDVHFEAQTESVCARFFLMEGVGESEPVDLDRRSEWLPVDAAVGRVKYEETRSLIGLAAERIKHHDTRMKADER